MPPTTQQRQDAGRQFGRDLDIENDTRRESGLAPLTTQRAPEGTQVVETGSVPASSLAAPVSRVNVPAPVENIVQPARGIDAVRDNLTFDIQEFRTNQAQERENFQQLQALGGGESFIDTRTRLTQESGMVANQTRLQDIQTQLAGLSAQSEGVQVDILNRPGATRRGNQLAMSAEQAKNNVRSFGLAAEASILQGNIESARTFVNDAMTTIYQDRQLGRQNLIDQNNALSNILDPQRAEILMQDNRRYEEEIAATQRVQSAVDLAMQSGATADDVKRMTDPTLTDEDRLATAQGIVSRGETEMRNLEIEQITAQINSSNRANQGSTGTLSTQVIQLEDGSKALVNSQTGEVIKNFGNTNTSTDNLQKYNTEKAVLDQNIKRVDEILSNTLGVSASTGALQQDRFGGLLTGSIDAELTGAANLFRFVPGIGNILGSNATVTQKGDVLAATSFIVNNATFDKLTALKADGATFGSLSDPERVAIGKAASDLAASAITNETGEITGFRGSQEAFERNMGLVLQGYQAAEEQLTIEFGLTSLDTTEASTVWNNQQ